MYSHKYALHPSGRLSSAAAPKTSPGDPPPPPPPPPEDGNVRLKIGPLPPPPPPPPLPEELSPPPPPEPLEPDSESSEGSLQSGSAISIRPSLSLSPPSLQSKSGFDSSLSDAAEHPESAG